MKYTGVAHHLCTNPELVALYRHGKSFKHLPIAHQKSVMDRIGDIATSSAYRDDPQTAMDDAIKLCATEGLEIGYATIKRDDGQYFTSVNEALKAQE